MSLSAKIIVVLAIVVGILNTSSVAANTVDHVVINEIHYHPDIEEDEPREFVELHNPSGSDIDLTGMAFTVGGDSSEPFDGLSIPANGYLVFAPVENTFQDTYGFGPDGTFEGKLKNSSSTIELVRDGIVVDTVSYVDGRNEEWPTLPDGDGPSLELSDPLADNDDFNNWHASDGAPTPRAANTVPEVPSTTIGDIEVDLDAADTITVSSAIDGSEGASFTYRVGFEDPTTMPMTEGPEGIFTAVFAAQEPGELVRYRIETDEGPSLPTELDDFTYHGFVIPDPTVTTGGAAIFEWFIRDEHYNALLADTLNRDLSFPAVLAYDGVVYDNVRVEIRGGTYARTTSPKQSFNFDMPSGVFFSAPGLLDYPVDEFALVSEWADDYFGRAESAWWLFEEAGFPHVHSFGVRLQRNGTFHGALRFQEKLDGIWRSQTDHDSGEFYKAQSAGFQRPNGFEKKSPKDDDLSRPNAVATGLAAANTASERTDFIFDTFDVPALINYAAVAAIVDHDDSAVHNFYAYYDLEGTERWSMIPWDLDGTWGLSIGDCKNIQPTTLECAHDDLMDAIYESPTLAPMFWARVGTLMDEVVAGDTVNQLHDVRIAGMGAELGELEKERWGRDASFADPETIAGFHEEIQARRDAYAAESRLPTFGDPTDVVIAEILPDPVDDSAEILELVNTGANPIDLSGWAIDAVFKDGATVPGGTILLPGSRLVLTDSIPELTTDHPNLANVVLVEHNGGLKSGGEDIELVTRTGEIADVVKYLSEDDDGWPELPAEGASLELLALDLDNDDGSNWAIATRDGGTPGSRNSVEEVGESEVTVIARGTTGEEEVRVVVNGSTTFDLPVTTTLASTTFTFEGEVNTVRVEFLNDQARPVDRNLHVDAIEVNGTRYQTEHPTVTSIGSWTNDNQCGPGNKQTEILHCNGHFTYTTNTPAEPPTPPTEPPTEPPTNGTNDITVIAWGTTGDEKAQLVINDTTYPFDVTTQRTHYDFTFDGDVETVRVEFLNDQARPVDRNLHVDAIEVNGTRYQTEHPTVTSIGSWTNDNQCGPGNKQTEILHCNGHFTYTVAN